MAFGRRKFLKFFGIGTIAATNPFRTAFSQELGRNTTILFNRIRAEGLEPYKDPLIKGDEFLTFILVRDYHGTERADWKTAKIPEEAEIEHKNSWRFDLENLKKLKNLGINLLGIEGWAGNEVDKKRGRRILIGQSSLLRYLLDKEPSLFNYVALEEENLQLIVSELLYLPDIAYLLTIREISKQIGIDLNLINSKIKLDMKDFEITNLIVWIKEYLESSDNSNFYDLLVSYVDTYIRVWRGAIEISGLHEIDEFISLLESKHAKTINKIRNIENYNFFEDPEVKRIVDDLREEYAVGVMMSLMLNKNISKAIIFFGVDHINAIEKLILKMTKGNANIYIVKEYGA